MVFVKWGVDEEREIVKEPVTGAPQEIGVEAAARGEGEGCEGVGCGQGRN